MANKASQFLHLIGSTKRDKRLGTLILFVTSRCNAFCKTCFYWDELNRPGDLTLTQIEKISRTMPPITDLWLSGGEPTLRPDLSRIVDAFVANNGIERLIIPTNGLASDRVLEIVGHALEEHPGLDLYLNLSIDGYGATHDAIRGVPGNWQKVLHCIGSLDRMKDKFGERFRRNVNTVVCAENYLELETLADYLWRNCQLDGHYFNIIRGETQAGSEIKQVPAEALPGIYRRAAELTERYGDRMFAGDDALSRFVKNVAYVGTITTHYRTQLGNFADGRAWPMPCTAGETIAVIDYNGDVRACELREKFATLADYDYDFEALWSAGGREQEIAAIDGGRACWCTHVCFIHDSLRHARRTLLYEVTKNYANRGSW
jgi:MoaA/NifB/PqqE/SkfB family radical SAM enzyme